jgi:hypothetical protein
MIRKIVDPVTVRHCFLVGVGIYRKISGDSGFLSEAVDKSLCWMQYQSPSDRYLVTQQPTSDWRDEQWVLGYGLFVNTYYIAISVSWGIMTALIK